METQRYGKIYHISLGVLVIWIFLLIDQVTKYIAFKRLKPLGSDGISLIKNVLKLQYLENYGAAFGMMQNKQTFFVIITTVFIIIAAIIYMRIPHHHRFRLLSFEIVMLISGAIGNLIDRLANGYVVDFIYLECIKFPIFNIADIYVTLGSVMLFLSVIFYYKDDDLYFLSKK